LVYSFQLPARTIGCAMDIPDNTTFARCEIRDHTWIVLPRPTSGRTGRGDHISLHQGSAPAVTCYSATSRATDTQPVVTSDSLVAITSCTSGGTSERIR
jgi:hypothetical protein